MSESNERLEQLIGRKLDGELLADESLELDKYLIRDPAARKCLEDSEKFCALAAALWNWGRGGVGGGREVRGQGGLRRGRKSFQRTSQCQSVTPATSR